MNIIGIPALVGSYDNYIWVLSQAEQAWVIDPGESKQVIEYLNKNRLQLKGVLITHFHHDHVDGIPALIQAFPDCHVYGPEQTENTFIQTRLKTGGQVNLADDFTLNVLDTPGHTHDHIAFYNENVLFCGDTLFTGGCGRKFSGTFKGFAESIKTLRTLPDQTGFYCAHEYTESNLKFAALVEPNNPELKKRIQNCDLHYPETLTQAQSSLALEKATNPFMRFDLEPIKSQLLKRGASDSDESLFQTLRQWKDQLDQSGELDLIDFKSLKQQING